MFGTHDNLSADAPGVFLVDDSFCIRVPHTGFPSPDSLVEYGGTVLSVSPRMKDKEDMNGSPSPATCTKMQGKTPRD